MKNRKAKIGVVTNVDEDARLRVDLHSPDEATRARAVRSVCPCHAGWGPFEAHLDAVARLTKDESPVVRASALHVFEDAVQVESGGLPTSRREVTNEMLRTRRHSRFRRDADDEPRSGDARRDRPRRHSLP